LQLADELDPGDRQLGDLLRSLELVDVDTLQALLMEARRQRRSLRQVLLSGREEGIPLLTLYQMALIEAGNLDGLVLGPMRVVDRLLVTPRETVYRVFDPSRGGPALLRHLAEAEMHDAVHPDEFRQRFGAAAAIQHPNVAATHEVLEINGRPAVVQEWLTGLPATDWPSSASVPGVWFRLMTQAALGVHTAHQAGLVHGRLSLRNVVLTNEGIVKISGFGDPAWLAGLDTEPGASADIMALGELGNAWASLGPRRKNGKTIKPLPNMLQTLLKCLQPESNDPYTSAEELLNDLERAGATLPDAADAWSQLLDHVRANGSEAAAWRKSA
jgi:hypothetical protein